MSHSISSRIVTIPTGLTLSQITQMYKDLGINLSFCRQIKGAKKIENQRDPEKKGYRIRVWDDDISDYELVKWSAEKLEREDIKVMTLLERLQFGLDYFKTYKEHPDATETVTLCAGTIFEVETSPKRFAVAVPTVCFFIKGVIVGWEEKNASPKQTRARKILEVLPL